MPACSPSWGKSTPYTTYGKILMEIMYIKIFYFPLQSRKLFKKNVIIIDFPGFTPISRTARSAARTRGTKQIGTRWWPTPSPSSGPCRLASSSRFPSRPLSDFQQHGNIIISSAEAAFTTATCMSISCDELLLRRQNMQCVAFEKK